MPGFPTTLKKDNIRRIATHLVTKDKYREELPLRGHLKCLDCGRNLTGSLSSGNGGNMLITIVKTRYGRPKID